MDKNKNKNYKNEESSSESDYETDSSYDSDKERKKIPPIVRLRETIKQKRLERTKGTKKEKENYDE
jgi:hypothetical protein